MLVAKHLSTDRNLRADLYTVSVDEEERIAYFYLWNLSGQLVGYQHYRPDADKEKHNSPKDGRYFTYVTRESEKSHHLAVWGLESLSCRDDLLFVLEGTFKAVPFHNRGLPAIATLTNNPKPIRNFLYLLSKSRRIIVVGDNDDGGSTTRSMSYEIVYPPDHVKDVDELTSAEFDEWIEEVLK